MTSSALILAVLSALILVAARPTQAQTETVLYNFAGSSIQGCLIGPCPQSSLTSDGAGNFYGVSSYGGLGYGIVFELSPDDGGGWNEAVLYSFCSVAGCADGEIPNRSYVIFDKEGNLYGTADQGGAYGGGVVWELSPVGASWTETVLYNFPYDYNPVGGLIIDPAGNLYGTGFDGLTNYGTVFELSPSGGGWTEQVIYLSNGVAALAKMDAAGNIFGNSWSPVLPHTVFELSPNGNGGWTPTVIHTFTGYPKDGSEPQGTPVLDRSGRLYGTTSSGGAYNYGTVYELSPPTKKWQKGKWTERILYCFRNNGRDGNGPQAGIALDAAGNIYGTTVNGGKHGDGTVFELAAQVGKGWYKEKVLWSFDGTNGSHPYDNPILERAGNLYGTTWQGGSSGDGVVFRIDP